MLPRSNAPNSRFAGYKSGRKLKMVAIIILMAILILLLRDDE